MPQDTLIIGTLAGVIASMGGFIVWLFKDSLTRANDRIHALEEREDSTLATLAANGASMLEILKVIVEIVRELRIVSEMERRSGSGGGSTQRGGGTRIS